MLWATVCEKIIIDFEKMNYGEKTTPYCFDRSIFGSYTSVMQPSL